VIGIGIEIFYLILILITLQLEIEFEYIIFGMVQQQLIILICMEIIIMQYILVQLGIIGTDIYILILWQENQNKKVRN